MTKHPHVPAGTIALAAFAGALIALQSRANGELSVLLGNSREAALVSFGTGFILLMVMALVSPRLRTGLVAIRAALIDRRLPRWQSLAGMMGAFFVIVQAFAVPRMGVAIFSVATIAGQSALSLVVDRVGFRSGVRHHITPRRVLTAAITVAAVGISVADRIQGSAGWAALLALGAGGVVAVQRALNAHITDYSGHSYATTWLNFFMGVAFLLVANLVAWQPLSVLPHSSGQWWLYSGGTLGVIYIAISSVLVQKLGVLLFTATTVGGQLLGSLCIDLAYPTPGVSLGVNVYVGLAVSMLGIVVGVVRTRGSSTP
jgi:transporter family-2 protein